MGWLDSLRGIVAPLLVEGHDSGVVSKMRAWWESDKESVARKFARGAYDPMGVSVVGSNHDGLTGFGAVSSQLRIEQDLIQRYRDYEEMDNYPETSSILDIYADDATVPDPLHDAIVWVVSEDETVAKLLSTLLHKRLRIEDDIWGLMRGLCEYGNEFAEMLVTSEEGVIGLNYLPPPTMRRYETSKGVLRGFLQDETGKYVSSLRAGEDPFSSDGKVPEHGVEVFEPWEVVHWRLRNKHLSAMYGVGVLDAIRWVWRRLVLLEDTMLIYKLTRAPARYAYYIDVGDLPPEQALAYVKRIRNEHQKRKILRHGAPHKMDFRMNPLTPQDDMWVPTRNGKDSTRIDVISGPDYQAIDDVQYFLQKLFSGAKVPKSYLGFDDQTNRATLSQEDVRFARTELRNQRYARAGLIQVCRTHLAAIGIDPDKVAFDVRVGMPSSIFELAQIEVMNSRLDVASNMQDYMPKEWIVRRILRFEEGDAATSLKEKRAESRDDARYDAETQAGIIKDFPELAQLGQGGSDAGGGGFGESYEVRTKSQMEEDARSEQRLDSLLGRLDKEIARGFGKTAREVRDAAMEVRRVARDLDARLARR